MDFIGYDCCQQFIDFLTEKIYMPLRDLKALIKKKLSIKVMAHNAHRYDAIFIFPILQAQYAASLRYIGTPTQIKFCQILDSFFVFSDSMELLPGSLAQLGKDFNAAEKKLLDSGVNVADFSFAKFQEDIDFKNKVLKYCRQDVRALSSVVHTFAD